MIQISLHQSVAVLIDADNVHNNMSQILDLSSYFGDVVVKRAYGAWNENNLKSHITNLDELKIERVQVNRIGKNATDHRLLVEIGELLRGMDYSVDVFVLVAGDGDFASACERIKERGSKVIGISNKSGDSKDLKSICDHFYYVKDIEEELNRLKQQYPIPPADVRQFFTPLIMAYHQLSPDDWKWVSYSELGAKLHELSPSYEEKFGKYQLSMWLANFTTHFECSNNRIRKIDPNPELTRRYLLLKAYIATVQSDGLAQLSEFGKELRKLARNYDEQFGEKRLSEWVRDYPDAFEIQDNAIRYIEHDKRIRGTD